MPVAAVVPKPVPVTVHPDAAARIDELGLRPEFERMLEHTLETVPGLESVRVELALPYDTGDEPSVTLAAARNRSNDARTFRLGCLEPLGHQGIPSRYTPLVPTVGPRRGVTMRGREFLNLSRHLSPQRTNAARRGVVIHAYSALMLECRDALVRWGRPVAPRQNVHSAVRWTLPRARLATSRLWRTIGRSRRNDPFRRFAGMVG